MKRVILAKSFSPEELNTVNKNAAICGIMPETAGLLYSRNIDTPEKIKRFLNPGKHNFSDPLIIPNMEKAAKRIAEAKAKGERVLVYGDYDADGVSAASILYRAFEKFGIKDLAVTVPNRSDGYGLNLSVIEKASCGKKFDLIVTVDCGISNVKEVEEIKATGTEVIVTDHHEIPEIIPNCICVNPKMGEKTTFTGLCGAGVAFEIARVLLGERAYEYLDYAALATVADSMELKDENRDIVYEGVKRFSKNVRPVFREMTSSLKYGEASSQTLAYSIAPKINAAGRMGDSLSALKLFISDNDDEIRNLSALLSSYNMERQDCTDRLYKEAKAELLKKGADKKIIMLSGENWNTGFIGIVAAKLVEEYFRPVIIFADIGGVLKGSCRSIEGINIFEALSSAKDLLVEFGGHSQAAGVTIKKENFEELEKRLDRYLDETADEETFVPKIYADGEIKGVFPMELAKELELLEPCGTGNKKPLFCVTENALSANPLKEGSPHIAFKTKACDMLKFSGLDYVSVLEAPVDKKILFEVSLSTYARQTYMKGIVKDVIPVIKRDDSLKLLCFENSLTGDLYEAKPIDTGKVLEIVGKNCAFIIRNPDDYEKFPFLDSCEKELFYRTGKGLKRCVLFAPSGENALADFKTVVYLDLPYATFEPKEGQNVYVNENADFFAGGRVDLSRDAMGKAYYTLKNLCGKRATSFTELYLENTPDVEPYQFVFAAKVFAELGIFYVSNKILRCDKTVRADLETSKIYRTVSKMVQKC